MTASSARSTCYVQSVIHQRHPIALDTHSAVFTVRGSRQEQDHDRVVAVVVVIADHAYRLGSSGIHDRLGRAHHAQALGWRLGPEQMTSWCVFSPLFDINSLTMFSCLFIIAFRSAFSDIVLDTLGFSVSIGFIVVTITLASFGSSLLTVHQVEVDYVRLSGNALSGVLTTPGSAVSVMFDLSVVVWGEDLDDSRDLPHVRDPDLMRVIVHPHIPVIA
ncbi:uncharacterized protein FSUBG_13730 [Fusarium subglutinans]|uniref:Uncharacterized protein n=1 Tax=Gibberella subglutinans TaxID=42677 RepID=A0A8H5KRP0_GIBSU|nr:uncharacterized protein FSUBG_13730 [Fusarium subglutinans]KAF5578712.1 hypothetical protein FSUBG_13730 [Fusarium subglutinans]